MDTIHDLLNIAAGRFGDAPALIFKPGFRLRRWSYNQLWEYSGRLAGYLEQREITKGDRVIIWAPNRPEWVVAFFACLRVGAIAVPLDMRSAPDFVARIVEKTAPKMAFISRFTGPSAADLDMPFVNLEEIEQMLEGKTPLSKEADVRGEDIAEVMFTSGTTGEPKGVILTHRNILSNVLAASQVVPVESTYRLLSLLPLSHMFEQTVGLLAPLRGGASIVYPTSRQPSILFRTMQESGITTMVIVPQALQLFGNAIEREVQRQGKEKQWQRLNQLAQWLPMWMRRILFRSVHRQFGGRLRFLTCGGAYLDPALALKWEVMGVVVLQGYGATETSPIIACNSFEHKRLDALGRVLPGQELKIAPDGEILTRGPNVTQGYWDAPEVSATAFEDGWYKTGDLGYVDEQSFLYFKGRKKDLIVLANGQNVYPEDIELLLKNHAQVDDGVVVGLPKEGGVIEVHAVLRVKEASRASEVIREVNQSMAAHQQIGGFTVWPEEDFPRTHTMKVKKPVVLEYLTAMSSGRESEPQPPPSKGDDALAATSELQRLMAQLCSVPASAITAKTNIGIELGLDSLGRVELLSSREQELGVYIDEEQVSPDTTVEELEALVVEGGVAQNLPLSRWPRRPIVRLLRAILQVGLILPLTRLFYTVRISGRENIRDLKGPVLFAANHTMGLDNSSIFMALTQRWCWNLAVAAAADDIFGARWFGNFMAFLGNAFPFSREGAVRQSLERLGQLLDDGWSVLIYPEGEVTIGGPMKPFKGGTGLLAVEARTPVVPIKVDLVRWGLFDNHALRDWLEYGVLRRPRRERTDPQQSHPIFLRGEAHIRIGKPLIFPSGTPYAEATAQLEEAVRSL